LGGKKNTDFYKSMTWIYSLPWSIVKEDEKTAVRSLRKDKGKDDN
jgi:hypothetical protein